MSALRDDVNVRILHALCDYAALTLGRSEATAACAEVLAKKGIDARTASDVRAWVPLDAFCAVADRLEELVGGDVVTDAITWVVPTRRDLSAVSISAVMTPRIFFKNLDHARAYFARHVHFEMTMEAPSRARAVLRYRDGLPRHAHSCRVARGVLHAVPLLFDLPPAEIEETACFARGDAACEYVVKWLNERPYAWLGAGAGAIVAAVGGLVSPTPLWFLAPAVGWLTGREVRMARLRRAMTRTSEEHRRVLADNEREFHRRYEEVRKINEELETRVAARTEELERTMQQLREQNTSLRASLGEMEKLQTDLLDAGTKKLLGDAVAEFAHEIRNPLTAVISNLEYIASTPPGAADVAELGEATREMREGLTRMRSVIGWFVDLYRSGPAQLAPRDLAAEVRSAIEPLAKRLGPAKVKLDLEPACVAAHEGQLGQVAANLVTNAAQAMADGGVVTVRVRARPEDGRAVMSVGDEGVGIPPDALDRVFERGFTTKAGPARGSGLGLYIARTIVERHAGRISVRSEPGRGAVFEVDLPLFTEEVEASSARPGEAASPDAPSSGQRQPS